MPGRANILREGLGGALVLCTGVVVFAVLGLVPEMRWIPEVPLLVAALLLPLSVWGLIGYRVVGRGGRVMAGSTAAAITGAIGGSVGGLCYVIVGKSALNVAVGLLLGSAGLLLGSAGGAVIGTAGALFGLRITGQAKAAPERVFTFQGSGGLSPRGPGGWLVRLDERAVLSIRYGVPDQIRDYGTFDLAADESRDLWELIRAAEFETRPSSTRMGIPDEVLCAFVLEDGTRTHTIRVWHRDAEKDERLAALLDGLGRLIKARTGEEGYFP
jgi:hypothetical protein